MRVRVLIQSAVGETLTAETDDAEAARAAIQEQAPDGYGLIQVSGAMPRGGRVIATAKIRLAESRELDGYGPDYTSAGDAARAQVPDGWLVISVRSVEA